MRWIPLLAVPLAAIALAGCGGSNNASSNTTTTTTETTSGSTTTTTETAMTETTTTEAGSSSTPNFASGRCKDLAQSAAKIGQDFSSGSASGNLQNAADEFQAFVKVVPSEIRSDVQTIANAISAYADALKGVDLTSGQTPSASDLQKIQAALSKLDQQKLQAAEQHINTWTQKNC